MSLKQKKNDSEKWTWLWEEFDKNVRERVEENMWMTIIRKHCIYVMKLSNTIIFKEKSKLNT